MSAYITLEANKTRLYDLHRDAAERRRASAFGIARRRTGRVVALVRPRQTAVHTRSATITG